MGMRLDEATQKRIDDMLATGQARVVTGKPFEAVEPVKPIEETIDEKPFQDAVIEMAERFGWRVYHTYRSSKSQAGFPDLTMARQGGRAEDSRVIFAELKREGEKPTADQVTWGEILSAIGGNVIYRLWRPSNWNEIVAMLTNS